MIYPARCSELYPNHFICQHHSTSHSQIGLSPGEIPPTDVSCRRRWSNFGVAFSLNLFLSRLLPFLLQAWHFTLLKLIGIFISYICCHVKWSGSCVLQHMLNKNIYLWITCQWHIIISWLFLGSYFQSLTHFSLQLTIFTHIFFILYHIKSSSHHLVWNHYSSVLIILIKWVKTSSHYHLHA